MSGVPVRGEVHVDGLVDGLVDTVSDGLVGALVPVVSALVALVCLLVVLRMRRDAGRAPTSHAAPTPASRPRRSRRTRSAADAAAPAGAVPALPDPVPPTGVPAPATPVAADPVPGASMTVAPVPSASMTVAPVPVAPVPAATGSGSSAAFAVAARRDITLLNRQLQTLDELERTETDPDTLQQLFLLDNLTMRLRRGAESLLVLAGSPPGRRVREATPVSDVVRTASAQIEFYERVRVDLTDDPPLAAVHVVPVAHLLAEVLENATTSAPPDAVVDVTGGCDDEAMHVVVRDSGLGMTPEELERARADLRAHDRVLSRTERLGLAVVGRIADRLGIGVTLSARADGPGTVVSVRLPRDLFDVAGADDTGSADAGDDPPVLPEPPVVPTDPLPPAAGDLPSGVPGGGSAALNGETPYIPVMAHGAHAAEPLSAGPRRTSRSRARAAGERTAAEGTATVVPSEQPAPAAEPAAPDGHAALDGHAGYAELPSFESILSGESAVVPQGPTGRHGRADRTRRISVTAPSAPPPASGATPVAATFYPDAAPVPGSPGPFSGPVPVPTPAATPGGDRQASSWAPGGPAGTAAAGGWSEDQSALAERASLQQEALSALSSMSSYRPQVSEATGAALLTQRRPAAVDAPLDPVEDAIVRDAEALRARLSAFRAATQLGREAGASSAGPDLHPTRPAEEMP
jgi:hypothetical protein